MPTLVDTLHSQMFKLCFGGTCPFRIVTFMSDCSSDANNLRICFIWYGVVLFGMAKNSNMADANCT